MSTVTYDQIAEQMAIALRLDNKTALDQEAITMAAVQGLQANDFSTAPNMVARMAGLITAAMVRRVDREAQRLLRVLEDGEIQMLRNQILEAQRQEGLA